MTDSKHPDNIGRLARHIRRVRPAEPPQQESSSSNVVSHPALSRFQSTDDPIVAITQLQSQQRDFHIDLHNTVRVNHKVHAQLIERLRILEQQAPDVVRQQDLHGKHIQLMAGQVDTLLQENDQLAAEVALLQQKQQMTTRGVEEATATLVQLERRRFTVWQLISMVGCGSLLLVLLIGQVRGYWLARKLTIIQNDIDVLYENDQILNNRQTGGDAYP